MTEATEPIKTVTRPDFELPTDRQQAMKILRRFNFKGLKIDSIEEPRQQKDGTVTARIYALTAPRLTLVPGGDPEMQMRRGGVTVVFTYDPDTEEVRADEWPGWRVQD